ncbi:hypothetical protein lerEdw1_007362 [Lerista edwardsae]|nr:hypothetical protein lerEdw1_007362 [Lerista edwardsae]
MGPSSSPAFLLLWGLWVMSAPFAKASLPSDLTMAPVPQMFLDFMLRFNKSYQTQEEMHSRFKIFTQNLESSRRLQATERGTAQYGVTQFSDLTGQPTKNWAATHRVKVSLCRCLGWPALDCPPLPPTRRTSDKLFQGKAHNTSCDWRKAGAVTAVKNQENCSSCWAFAAVSNIEALWNIHRHVPRNVSVQEMIDCTYNRKGCEGGYAWDGFHTVINRGGLSNSRLYPYSSTDQRCQKHRGRTLTQIDGYDVLPRDEQYIANIVASQGPVTALLNAKGLQSYREGTIPNPQACSPEYLDHVVTIVGFGKGELTEVVVKPRHRSKSGPYWIIQNSWGEQWGEKGYFRLHRGTNACGIAMYAATAVVRNSGKKKPLACPP